MDRILCVNGPNLDRLGRRQPEVYGSDTLKDLEHQVAEWGSSLGLDLTFVQSGHEGTLIEALHDFSGAGVILNPGAFTHTSAALGDAVASIDVPVVEVHLSNIRSRERWRRRSVIAPAAAMTIFGRGLESYRAAMRHLVNRRRHPVVTQRYGPHPDQVIDLRHVSGSGMAVVLFHGGFWSDAWGRDTTESWAANLADRGIPTANVEYRRLDSGGGAETTTSDAAEALAAAADALTTQQVLVVGHSAGAQLAIHAALTGPLSPVGVVCVSGLLDLEAASASGLGDGLVAQFATDISVSPNRLPAPAVPVALVHGAEDHVVPPEQSERYATYLRSRSVEPRLSVVPDSGHFEVLAPDSRAWEAVLEVLEEMAVSSTGPA